MKDEVSNSYNNGIALYTDEKVRLCFDSATDHFAIFFIKNIFYI